MKGLRPLPKRWLRLTAALPIGVAALGLYALVAADLARTPRSVPRGAPTHTAAPAPRPTAPVAQTTPVDPADRPAAELPRDVLAAWRLAETLRAERALSAAPTPDALPMGTARDLGRVLTDALTELPSQHAADAPALGRGLARVAELATLDPAGLEGALTQARDPAARLALLRAWVLVVPGDPGRVLEPLILGDRDPVLRREALTQLVVLGETDRAERLLEDRLAREGVAALPRLLPRSPRVQERLADAFLRADGAAEQRALGRALLALPGDDAARFRQRVLDTALGASGSAEVAAQTLAAALPATREALESVHSSSASPSARACAAAALETLLASISEGAPR